MSIRQVLGRHQEAALRHLSGHLIRLEPCMQGRLMQNTCDLIQGIFPSTRANELVLPVMDMDTRK